MAAHARHLAAQQGLRALSTPLGQPAPFMHCHADDTTIHAASPADAAAILAGSTSLHCQATGARMQTAKSTGMGIGSLQHLVGPDGDTGIALSAAGSATTHLGIPLSTDPDAAARTLYTAILQRLDRRIARWSAFGSASWAGHMSPGRCWCPCSPTMPHSSECQETSSGSSARRSTPLSQPTGRQQRAQRTCSPAEPSRRGPCSREA